jgi:predicted TIM-barrel fold metal-dependent hydrolase
MWVGELVQYKCGMEFNEKSWLELFAHCALHGHTIQLHNSRSIVDVATKFSEMQIVCSHVNIPLLETLAEKENIWLDISGSCGGFTEGALETALKIFGADRLLFGTDFTGYEPEVFINRVDSAIKNLEDRGKIYSGNIIKLLAKTGSLPIC